MGDEGRSVGEEGCGDVCFLNIALEFCRERLADLHWATSSIVHAS